MNSRTIKSSTLIDSILSFSTYGSPGKRTYTFDNDGNLIFCTYYSFSNFNSWELIRRIRNIFDHSGQLIYKIHEDWVIDRWVLDIKESYFYDNLGNNIQILQQIMVDDKLENVYRISKTYDSEMRLRSSINKV